MIPDSQSVKIEFPLGNGWHQFLLFVLSELWPAKGKQLSGRPAVYLFITARKRSLGQGNIFTSVCHSFCPAGGIPVCNGQGGVCQHAMGVSASGSRGWGYQADTPQTTTEAGGTHPTGMHSCIFLFQLRQDEAGFVKLKQIYGIFPQESYTSANNT